MYPLPHMTGMRSCELFTTHLDPFQTKPLSPFISLSPSVLVPHPACLRRIKWEHDGVTGVEAAARAPAPSTAHRESKAKLRHWRPPREGRFRAIGERQAPRVCGVRRVQETHARTTRLRADSFTPALSASRLRADSFTPALSASRRVGECRHAEPASEEPGKAAVKFSKGITSECLCSGATVPG